MSYFRNQEVQITGRFIEIADNGSIVVRIKGIDNVRLEVDPSYVKSGDDNNKTEDKKEEIVKEKEESPIPVKKKSKKKSKLEEAADDAWGDDDEEEEKEKEATPKEEPKPTKSTLVAISDCNVGDEQWHLKHKLKSIEIEENLIIRTTKSKAIMCAFGKTECAEDGKIYHWKIKIVEGNNVNIGILQSNQCKANKKGMWWVSEEGYAWWSEDGLVYHSDKFKKYGDKVPFGAGDLIDVYLNLGAKRNISFGKNGTTYKKAFKLPKDDDISYRLGVGMGSHPHTIQIVEFDIS